MVTAKIPIKAVLFDFWDTLVYDIPDLEFKRGLDRCERIKQTIAAAKQLKSHSTRLTLPITVPVRSSP